MQSSRKKLYNALKNKTKPKVLLGTFMPVQCVYNLNGETEKKFVKGLRISAVYKQYSVTERRLIGT